MPPERFGKYEVVEEIGIGGNGTVFKARDPDIDLFVAVKVLHEHLQNRADAVNRFIDDAKILAKLNHPNIVKIYGIDKENHYYIMELVDGPTLKELVTSQGSLDPKRSLNIARQIAEALRTIHDQGFLHRDIKPQNVSVSDDDHITLLDFGIAQTAESDSTTAGAAVGSIEYMAPEQFTDTPNLDSRIDIYSLGVVMYECLTGQLPFPSNDESNVWQVVDMITNTLPDRISHIAPNIPAYIDDIVMRCLEKDRNNRRRSSAEVLVEIENAIKLLDGGRSTIFSTISSPMTGGSRGKIWATAGLLLLICTGGGWFYLSSQKEAIKETVSVVPNEPHERDVEVNEEETEIDRQPQTPAEAKTRRYSVNKQTLIKDNDKININTADAAELVKIPGVGPKTAEQIVSVRNEKGGRFESIDSLLEVTGIGAKKYERMKDWIKLED